MKISVVIPLFNKKDSVIRAIHSVLNQTVLPAEIIIVNDGSTDNSEQVVENFNHELIQLVHQKNAGVSVARNKGIEIAKGEWIAFLDADDEWQPNFLQEMVALQQDFPSCNLLACAYDLQDYLGNSTPIVLNKIPFPGVSGILTNYFEVASCSHPPIWSSAVIVKKKALHAIGGFPVGIKSGEDLLTWARLAVYNQIGYTTRPLAVFIQEAAHTYADMPNRIPEKKDSVGDALVQLLQLNPNVHQLKQYISSWKKMRASIYLRLGESRLSRSASLQSLSFNPFNKKVYLYIILSVLPKNKINSIFKKFGT